MPSQYSYREDGGRRRRRWKTRKLETTSDRGIFSEGKDLWWNHTCTSHRLHVYQQRTKKTIERIYDKGRVSIQRDPAMKIVDLLLPPKLCTNKLKVSISPTFTPSTHNCCTTIQNRRPASIRYNTNQHACHIPQKFAGGKWWKEQKRNGENIICGHGGQRVPHASITHN